MTAARVTATTVDAFLGGRVEAVQPKAGHHRAGLEAVFLAAALETAFDGAVVDLGAGVGVAGMAIAARCNGAQVVLAERDETAVACARAALERPANRSFSGRVSIVTVDISDPESARAEAGLARAVADAVVMNPPFHRSEAGTASPNAARAAAHVLAGSGLDPWLRAAASVLKPQGRLIVIFRADRLDALLAALAGRFGAAAILPIQPRQALPAHRVLVDAVKSSRAAARILPPLVLHGDAGSAYLPNVERILRDGVSLSEAHPAWGQ